MAFNHVYFATLKEPSFDKCWQNKLETLPASIIEHCLKFHQIADQQRRFLGYSLLRYYLTNHGINEKELSQISYFKNKKPFFANLPHIHFNLSYSNEFAICAFSDNPIGIDIEKINENINLDNFKSVFSEVIWNKISNSPTPIESFYIYWTQMEAVIKADGMGITGPIQQIIYNKTKIAFNNIERELICLPIKEGYVSHVVGANLSNLKIKKIEVCN